MCRDMLSLCSLVQPVLAEATERLLSLTVCKDNFSNQGQGHRGADYRGHTLPRC